MDEYLITKKKEKKIEQKVEGADEILDSNNIKKKVLNIIEKEASDEEDVINISDETITEKPTDGTVLVEVEEEESNNDEVIFYKILFININFFFFYNNALFL